MLLGFTNKNYRKVPLAQIWKIFAKFKANYSAENEYLLSRQLPLLAIMRASTTKKCNRIKVNLKHNEKKRVNDSSGSRKIWNSHKRNKKYQQNIIWLRARLRVILIFLISYAMRACALPFTVSLLSCEFVSFFNIFFGMPMMRTKQINYNNFNKFIARSCLTE